MQFSMRGNVVISTVAVFAHYGAVGANFPTITVHTNWDAEWTLHRTTPSGCQTLSGQLDRGSDMVWHHCCILKACFYFYVVLSLTQYLFFSLMLCWT